jgi:hypothetical protein
MSIHAERHVELRRSIREIIETENDPRVYAWEAAGIHPAHEVTPKFGGVGFLGIDKRSGK